MQIISLQAENIKRLVAVEIKPDGALVQITGRNAMGKSSVLDAIWWAVAGAKHIQSAPIRAGAAKARIRLDLGEIVVTRTFRRQEDETFTTAITVENAEGARYQSPQKILDGLIGALSLDPLEFKRFDPKQQLATLKALVPGVDFDSQEQAIAAEFAKRAEINKLCQQARARADAIKVPDGTPDQTIDVAELVAQLEAAGAHNTSVERQKAALDELKRSAAAANERLSGLETRRQELLAQVATLDREIADQKIRTTCGEALAAAADVGERIDTADIRRQIDGANVANKAIAAKAEKKQLERDALMHEIDSGKLTQIMKDRTAAMAKAVAKADLPIKGLALGEGEVLLDGLPFSQASDAQQLRTSMAIAMAMSPKLRVIRVRDGSLLDADGLKLVAEMAEDRGFQVWIERVDASGKVGFVIEDGSLKGAPIAEAAE